MLARAMMRAELRMGRMTSLCGPGGTVKSKSGTTVETSFFAKVGLGGRMGGRFRLAP